MTSTPTATVLLAFVFDKNYRNNEQVRPYYEGYAAVRAELDAADLYPYNDTFKGRIPGIEGPSEDTAIYLLQTMHDLDALAVKVAAFLADGGRRLDHTPAPDEAIRGTIVHVGFFMGGTGWAEYPSARLVTRNGFLTVLEKGKRSVGNWLTGGYVLIR